MDKELLKYLDALRTAELDIVLQFLPPGASILEFGAGLGFQARELDRHGFRVKAVDVTEIVASSETVYPVQPYDGSHLPFEDASFDVIFSSNVLEHIPHLGAICTELCRVLRPDGLMIHVLPSATWRFWTSLAEFVTVPRKIYRCFLPASNRSGDSGNRRPMPAIDAFRQLVRPFCLLRHGESGNALTELYSFSRFSWRHRFRTLGFDVLDIRSCQFFYTGEIICGKSLPFPWRRRLALILGSSTNLWLLKPSRHHHKSP